MERFLRFTEYIKGYRIEVGLLSIAFVITCISIGLFFTERKTDTIKPRVVVEKPKETSSSIVIDIEGAVINPGVYKLEQNARLVDALKSSGGLSEEADLFFFFRNFNKAEILADQEKIYIPSQWEVLSGLYTRTTTSLKTDTSPTSETLIDINNASETELEGLPSVGKVTVGKIVSGRPYTTVEELIEKNIVGKSTYEKIKDLITIN